MKTQSPASQLYKKQLRRSTDRTPVRASVIILNYNGERVIETTLDSVYASKLPAGMEFEVIVVDNHSADSSARILKRYAKKCPEMRLILHPVNAGFTGGNNVGIAAARGEYIVLLNNDVVVSPTWLAQLIKTADADTSIFAVNSKVQLFPYFFPIQIATDLHGLDIEAILVKGALAKYAKRAIKLFYAFDNAQRYTLHVPLSPIDKEDVIDVSIKMPARHIHMPTRHFQLLPHPALTLISMKTTPKHVVMNVSIQPKKIGKKELFSKVQNAGIIMYDNGSGRDRGAVVRYFAQDYEKDIGQFEDRMDVYAACAAAVLYRASVIREIGPLGEDFFMYYEDVDISERARLRGYRIVYEPSAVVRHMHALSSEEWSPFFIYHSEKGRLVHMAHHFPISVVLYQWYAFTIVAWMRFAAHVFARQHWEKDIQYIRVSLSVALHSFDYLRYRSQHSPADEVKQNYDSLRTGSWLFAEK